MIQANTAFIFDMDGTMIDNMDVHVDIWIELLAKQGVPMTPERFHEEASGKRNAEIFRLFLGDHLSDADIALMAEEKEATYRELHKDEMKPVPGLIPFLQQAQSRGIQMAVATSAYRPNVDFVLDGLQIRHFFDAVISAEDVSNSKPAPDCFLLAAERLARKPAECVVFEDSLSGIEAARQAGMATAVITTTLGNTAGLDASNIIYTAANFARIEINDLVIRRANHE